MDGTPHRGFHVNEGTYENYARQIDPAGEEIRGASSKHLAPNASVGGDGFSALGDETGFSNAYAGRMQSLQERLGRVAGNWGDMGDAARQTAVNYQGVEDDQAETVNRIGRDIR